MIQCKDGSKSFTRDRINDNFCDCLDGSDEPGTLFTSMKLVVFRGFLLVFTDVYYDFVKFSIVSGS